MDTVSPRSLALLVLIACSPVPPGSEPDTTTGTSTGTDGVSSSSVTSTPTTTGGSTTDPATGTSTDTTGATSTTAPETSTTTDALSTSGPGSDTTTGFVCNWHGNPDAEGFCPLLAAPNADISGDTPLGPIAFDHAYFSLFPCADCPYASDGAIAFYAAPNGPMDPKADTMILDNYATSILILRLGAEEVVVYGSDENDEVVLEYVPLDVPDVMETNPPLDPNAPPTLTGKLSITGGGWNVSGEFTATLCRQYDLEIPCE